MPASASILACVLAAAGLLAAPVAGGGQGDSWACEASDRHEVPPFVRERIELQSGAVAGEPG